MSRQALPDLALQYLQRDEAKGSEQAIIRFHCWLRANDLDVSTLTAADPQRFFIQPFRKHSGNCRYYYRRVLGGYLFWLRDTGVLNFDPTDAGLLRTPRARVQLPPEALAYLRLKDDEKIRPYLIRFQSWLESRRLIISEVTAAEVQRFFTKPFRKVVVRRHTYDCRRALTGYLVWLYDAGVLQFDPAEITLRRKIQHAPLSPLAVMFIQSLKPTVRSWRSYHSSLLHFHSWLDNAKLSLLLVGRNEMEQWFLSLSNRGLHPSSRIRIILSLRTYFRWLAERGEIRVDPDVLIRRTDLPKLPQYLPRPLSPTVDRELQRRLAESTDPLWLGLCLMRQTGLRLGELLGLEEDCLRLDLFGNRFLKVPLGKLDTERLVPLNPATYAILCSIKASAPLPRQRLLQTKDGRRVPPYRINQALVDATAGLIDSKPITSHRLRHSYATELLSAGMSLVGIMKLLGHRNIRMTLRYTAVTQEHTGREYFAAMQQIETRYAINVAATTEDAASFSPIKALSDVLAWMQNSFAHQGLAESRSARTIAKRIVRIQTELRALSEE